MRDQDRRHRLAGPRQPSGERGLLTRFIEPEQLTAVEGDVSRARWAELHAGVVAVLAVVKDGPWIAGLAETAGDRCDRVAAVEYCGSVAGSSVRHRADCMQTAAAAQCHLCDRSLTHNVRANEAAVCVEYEHIRIAGRGRRADGGLRAIFRNVQASNALLWQQPNAPRIPLGNSRLSNRCFATSEGERHQQPGSQTRVHRRSLSIRSLWLI